MSPNKAASRQNSKNTIPTNSQQANHKTTLVQAWSWTAA
jgi:hypothetical protein